ncbi:MAG: response regulator transcription factor [Gemmatimonadetes bacterium]|nr:response regulator transcription factor [Gemmatimonadota bacterium]
MFLVDDSAPVRERLVEVLRRLDFVDIVGQASLVRDAVAWIPLARPHVVLLDLALPDGNGLQVLEATRALTPAPQYAVLTNYASPAVRKRCLEAGVRFFLDKSMEFGRLPEVLSQFAQDLG